MTDNIHDSDYPDAEHEMGPVADWLALKGSNAKGQAPSIHQKGLLRFMARPERFELPTPRFEAWCSIQLSYGRRREA
jgi:hypothetical protein